MKTNLKNQKGITLVALVVTIIVLLILAGVSISLVAGGDGILLKASDAVDTNTVATAKERVAFVIIQDQLEYYEQVYVDKAVSVNKDMGEWIYEYHGEGDEVTTDEDYVFTITEDATAGYIVTILRDRTDGTDTRLKEDVTGKLSVDGQLTWDDEGSPIQAPTQNGSLNGGN